MVRLGLVWSSVCHPTMDEELGPRTPLLQALASQFLAGVFLSGSGKTRSFSLINNIAHHRENDLVLGCS